LNVATGGFGAGVYQPDFFTSWNKFTEFFGQFDFQGSGRAEAGAAVGGLLYGGEDFRVGMAQDHRAPREHIVDVSVAIDVVEAAAFGAFDEGWRAAHSAEGPHGRVDPAGDAFFPALHPLL
jgi:hypothetical protein